MRGMHQRCSQGRKGLPSAPSFIKFLPLVYNIIGNGEGRKQKGQKKPRKQLNMQHMHDSQGERKKCSKLSAKRYNVLINFAIAASRSGQEYFSFYLSVRAIAQSADEMCAGWSTKRRSSSLTS